MKPGSIVIIGCGGFGREVFSIICALRSIGQPWVIEGFLDDNPSQDDCDRINALGSRIIGRIEDVVIKDDLRAVIAVGSPQARESIDGRLVGSGLTWATLVHPHSSIGLDVSLGEGTIISSGARLTTNIRVGRHVQIDQNATVGHDSRISDFSRLNPQACLSGSVEVNEQAVIGAGAVVLQGLTIGARAVVGAAACVVTNVAAASIVKGVPAR